MQAVLRWVRYRLLRMDIRWIPRIANDGQHVVSPHYYICGAEVRRPTYWRVLRMLGGKPNGVT